MGDYGTGRFALGVEASPWVATLFVDNLFDTEANTFAYSDPFRLPDAQAVTPPAAPHHWTDAEVDAALVARQDRTMRVARPTPG